MHTKEDKLKAFSRLLDIQERLRKECPWDSKQTNESLRPNTIEETFELADALLKNDSKNICKELGDVMEHVIFYSMLGEERGTLMLLMSAMRNPTNLCFDMILSIGRVGV